MANRRKPSPLDRFLRLFTDVRAGEGATVVLLAVNVFLILAAYSVLKPVREALILAQGSAELKSYISAGQVGVLALAVPAYGVLATRLARRRLINVVTAFFIVCLVLFYVLSQMDVPLGVVFFLWIGIFSLMIVAQFWSFANDIYTNEEGERLFPIVAFGASAGAVLGAVIAGRLIEPLGVYQLMLVGGAFLFLALMVSNRVDTRERHRAGSLSFDLGAQEEVPAASGEIRIDSREMRKLTLEDLEAEPEPDEDEFEIVEETGQGPFELVFRCRFLLMIAFLMLFLNWVNTTGGYMLDRIVLDTAEGAVAAGQAAGLSVEQYIGKFYSDFNAVVNLVGLLIQLFLVSRIIKYFGIRIAILFLPLIALGVYGILAFYPLLQVVRWAKTAENATDYSLNNTVRHALFLPCTREQKYKAKQAIDSFFWRAGDVLSALLVFVGTSIFAWTINSFAVFNIGLVLIWLVLAFFIGREYTKLVASGRPPCVSLRQESMSKPETAVAGAAREI